MQKKLKVLVLSNFILFDWEKGNSRFTYLLERLCKNKNLECELVTSTFYHTEKEQRKIDSENIKNLPYKTTFIYEPGYKKNICIKRIISHYILSKNLKRYLQKLKEKPDVIYCAIPSLDFAMEAARYAKKNNIRFIIDIQDLWPEAFKMIFNIPLISNIIYFPMKKKAKYIYKQADDIVAVSETYANRAISVNNKYKNKVVTFLGTDLDYFDKCKKENTTIRNDNTIKIVYIGTLGYSYDIKVIIDALKKLEKKYDNLEFFIMGDGSLKEKFEKYCLDKQIKCNFMGRLKYSKMIGILCNCDIAVNPISHGAAQSVINKVGDYAAAGLPVINTQECEEYRKIVRDYNIGYNCINGDADDVADKIEEMIKNPEKMKEFGANNRKLAEEKFNRNKTYDAIIELIFKQM